MFAETVFNRPVVILILLQLLIELNKHGTTSTIFLQNPKKNRRDEKWTATTGAQNFVSAAQNKTNMT